MTDARLTLLDLFSGMGGFSLAFEAEGFRTLAFSEVCPDASRVLAGRWPDVPNLGDVGGIRSDDFLARFGAPLVLAGGVPCQPASLLGKRRGAGDARWLWPEALRLVGDLRPGFALFENPPALLTLDGGHAFDGIAGGLAALGYDLWWDVLPAAALGAGHLRERLFLLAADADRRSQPGSGMAAHTALGRKDGEGARAGDPPSPADPDRQRCEGQRLLRAPERQAHPEAGRSGEAAPRPDTDGPRLEGHAGHGAGEGRSETRRPVAPPDLRSLDLSHPLWWQAQSPVQPLAHGLPGGLVAAALRLVGNSVVPQVLTPFAQAIKARALLSFNEQ